MLAILLCFSQVGCATLFRGTKDRVWIESTPAGATGTISTKNNRGSLGPTPSTYDVPRQGATQIVLAKEGYEEHRGVVKKTMNGGWLVLDVITCLPLTCIPLLIDSITGAWYDVDRRYVATMTPGAPAPKPTATTPSAPASPPPAPPSVAQEPSSTVGLSESERKATARAAYMEGASLQESGNCVEALIRFEAAQKFYPAPTHLLHIGQCQAATGKLVEASETFETLGRTSLTKDAPDVFREAQAEGRKQLTQLKARIPTLRIGTVPPPKSLASLIVRLNGRTIPNEVLGIARPVNPGHYRVTVWAADYQEGAAEIDLGEGGTKTLEMKLVK